MLTQRFEHECGGMQHMGSDVQACMQLCTKGNHNCVQTNERARRS